MNYAKESQSEQIIHEGNVNSRRPSATRSKFLNCILEDKNEVEGQSQEHNGGDSTQFTEMLANLIKVQEDYHDKDNANSRNEDLNSGISQQIIQRKHSKFVNKSSALTNLAKSQTIGLISKSKLSEK